MADSDRSDDKPVGDKANPLPDSLTGANNPLATPPADVPTKGAVEIVQGEGGTLEDHVFTQDEHAILREVALDGHARAWAVDACPKYQR